MLRFCAQHASSGEAAALKDVFRPAVCILLCVGSIAGIITMAMKFQDALTNPIGYAIVFIMATVGILILSRLDVK